MFFRIEGNLQSSPITDADLKRLISIDRETKLNRCSLYCLGNIQISELFKFADKHMEPTGMLNVRFAETRYRFIANFWREWWSRKKIIPTCILGVIPQQLLGVLSTNLP